MVQETGEGTVKYGWIRKYKVIADKYYILDFSEITRVRLLNFYFLNRRAAEKCIKVNFLKKKDLKYYAVVLGSEVDNEVARDKQKKASIFTKYDYPVEKMTKQERKTFRTVMRRRLRRMDLLTLVKPRKHYKKKPDYIKHIKNEQKVAKCPHTAARVIQIQRKNPKYYYLILEKSMAEKKGLLFILNCLRFNKDTGEIIQTEIKVKRTDLLIPFLIWDLEKMIHDKIKRGKNPDYYGAFGFSVAKDKEQQA